MFDTRHRSEKLAFPYSHLLNNARRVALMFFISVLGLSMLIAAWPARKATPLISKTDWVINGAAFQNTQPGLYEVSDSIRNSPQAVYWRTWSPSTQATKADIRTKPFKPRRYMAVPYGGFAGTDGIKLYLVCLKSGAQLPVASARTNTQMTEALLRLPSEWCPGDVALNAYSASTTFFITVGTPFSISWVEYYKNSFIGLIGILAFTFTFAFAWSLIFLPSVFLGFNRSGGNWLTSGMICFGLIGYALFFIYFASHHAGRIISAVLLLSVPALFIWLRARRRNVLARAWQSWKTPTALWAAVVISAFCLAVATHNGAGPWTVNALFTPVQWSTDDQLPMLISEHLFHGHDPRLLGFSPWKISDRPPLAYGLMSTLRLVSWLSTSHRDGYPLFYQYQEISGIVINGLWAVALYYLLTAMRLDRRDVFKAMVIIALTPFAIFNSVFIWPKMLGAAFALVAFTLLLEPIMVNAQQTQRKFDSKLIVAAALSCLGLLSHGGTAFGIIAAIIFAFALRGLPSVRFCVGAAITGLLVLAPWALWQHFEQPPGNALIKYAFAGTFGFGEEGKSLFATIHDAYANLTLSSWLRMKELALKIIFAGQATTCGMYESAPVDSYDGALRIKDFFNFVPSLRFLAIGIVPLILGKLVVRDKATQGSTRLLPIMMCTGLLAVGFYVLFGFDCYINHAQSYESILEVLASLTLALILARKWYFDLVCLLSICYGAIVWVIEPLLSARYVDIAPVLVLCGIALAACYRMAFGDSRPQVLKAEPDA
ncbi:hypothetical protein [Dyella psychrodurans]|uniref:Uncharacterized protein n=1 Tax=Dyella psychrodurans TaxID=1927960 RepID=A0A370X500_9GAMM|nr:hypothetical protein [Dyella psychrodurans]RDS83412.1 hypothetical protein DWU99_12855 [Dyella psychrodurans]